MDYKVFFSDVALWTQQANQAAMKYGMADSNFWLWVADSSGAMCQKYQDNPLVIKQMIMLTEWLEEVYEKQQKGM